MDFVCVEDYERRAQSMFNNPEELDYFNAAACLGNTARNNIEAYKKYKILPKVLRDVSDIDTTTVIFGESLKFPVGISPTANHILAHDEAELATGKGGIRADTCMIHSLFARKSIEEVTEACQGKGLRWMQIQPIKQKDIIVDVISRAEKNGYKAIVVTCDNPGVPIHYFRLRKPFKNRSVMKLGNFSEEINNYLFNNTDGVTNSLVRFGQDINEPAHSWEWIDWLRSKTSLPIVLKGIMRPDDAIEAIKHDIQGILVSNHGGRMLDDVPATVSFSHT
jgi:(S)-2-hydroxy-acid oxidase